MHCVVGFLANMQVNCVTVRTQVAGTRHVTEYCSEVFPPPVK